MSKIYTGPQDEMIISASTEGPGVFVFASDTTPKVVDLNVS